MNKVLQIKEALHEIPDARSKQGISHPFHGILARQIYLSHIVEWAKIYGNELKKPLGFKSVKPPDASTLSRTLAKNPFIASLGRPWTRLSVLCQEESADSFRIAWAVVAEQDWNQPSAEVNVEKKGYAVAHKIAIRSLAGGVTVASDEGPLLG